MSDEENPDNDLALAALIDQRDAAAEHVTSLTPPSERTSSGGRISQAAHAMWEGWLDDPQAKVCPHLDPDPERRPMAPLMFFDGTTFCWNCGATSLNAGRPPATKCDVCDRSLAFGGQRADQQLGAVLFPMTVCPECAAP